MTRATWVILTGEYPPDPGGVSDYTRQVAAALAAAGDDVHVLAPPPRDHSGTGVDASKSGVNVYRLRSGFRLHGLGELAIEVDRILNGAESPPRLLVQYVPHAFGYKAMNVPLCRWLARRSARCPLGVMFHEVAFPLRERQPLRHRLLARVNRYMARVLARSAARMFVSTPQWGQLLEQVVAAQLPYEWMPVPSGLPTSVGPEHVAAVRNRFAPPGSQVKLIGHFGTYGHATADLLRDALCPIAAEPSHVLLLIGRGGEAHVERLSAPSGSGRVHATGGLAETDAAAHLGACDVLVQPYLDGVSARRSSTMAGLALGVPIVTNAGVATEAVWAETGGVSLLASSEPPASMAREAIRLAADPVARDERGRRGRQLYLERFDLTRTVATLRGGTWTTTPAAPSGAASAVAPNADPHAPRARP